LRRNTTSISPSILDEGLAAARGPGGRLHAGGVRPSTATSSSVYRGRIDNKYSSRLKARQADRKLDLSQALGRDPLGPTPSAEPATKAVGCPIDRDAKAGPGHGQGDLLPRCAADPAEQLPGVPSAGRVGTLRSDEVRHRRSNGPISSRSTRRSGSLPPWKPSAGVAMHHERRLTDKEIATIADWGRPRHSRRRSERRAARTAIPPTAGNSARRISC